MVASQKAYDEAMMVPRMRLQIPEPDILQGSVEEMSIVTGLGTYTRPWGVNGAFAVVYKYRTGSGQPKALRCFRVAMQPDIHERYEVLSHYFRKYMPSITAGFHYYSDGILIEEQVRGTKQRVPHSVIVMDWVEGVMLLDKVHVLCQQQDQQGLADLADRWLILLDSMRQVHMAHGDLAGGNVIVRNDGSLVLIDYDGCYVPDLEGKKPQVNGQPDYQHPEMKKRLFNERMDDFSAFAIYCSLRALQLLPHLWQKYAPITGSGNIVEDRLLFSSKDFQKPEQSSLFTDLEATSDPLLYVVTCLLKEACKQPIEDVFLPALGTAFASQMLASYQIQGSIATITRQREQIEFAGKQETLRHALALQLPGEVLRLAQKIEATANGPVPDKVLRDLVHEFRQQFIAQYRPQHITARIHPRTNEVYVQWEWPADDLVKFAVVVWRNDRWPTRVEEEGTYRYHPVTRQGQETQGTFRFKSSVQGQRLYIQIYFAEPACLTPQNVIWLYSSGDNAQTSRYEVFS